MNNDTSQSETIETAKNVVGENPPNNRSLEAEKGGRKHIERLEPHPEAAPLVRILKSEEVQDVFRRYEENDAAAVSSQNAYKRARVLLLAPLAGAVAIAVICFLVPADTLLQWSGRSDLKGTDTEAWVRLLPVWLIILFLLWTAGATLVLNPSKAYEKWMVARGVAEALRRELFERVLATPAKAASGSKELPPLPLKLEYFRRYQIQVQEAYHRTRGPEHERAAARARWFQFIFVVLLIGWAALCFGGTLSGFTEQGALSVPSSLIGLASSVSGGLQLIEIYNADFITLIGSVALALVYGGILLHSFLSSSVRNAARYRIMRDNFEKLGTELGDVRVAAARSDEARVHAFVARVHSIMSLELADWVRLQDLDRGKEQKQFVSPNERGSAQPTSS